jgi:hypothetical protein
MRPYPAIARRFKELSKLQSMDVNESNTIRTEAYQDMRNKLPKNEQLVADRAVKRLAFEIKAEGASKGMFEMMLGEQSVWELIVAVAQAMEWQNWPT